MIPMLRVISSEVSLGKIVSLYSFKKFVPYSIARVCGSFFRSEPQARGC